MKWLTQKEIKTRAKKSKREAIKVSWEHWEQLATATMTELTAAIGNKQVGFDEKYCGLCQRHKTKVAVCIECPLDDSACIICCKEYDKAMKVREVFWTHRFQSTGFDKFIAFQKTAKIMANKLKRLLKKKSKVKDE